jgi:hypothetical protein
MHIGGSVRIPSEFSLKGGRLSSLQLHAYYNNLFKATSDLQTVCIVPDNIFLGDLDDDRDDLSLSQTNVSVMEQGEQRGQAAPVSRDGDVCKGAVQQRRRISGGIVECPNGLPSLSA